MTKMMIAQTHHPKGQWTGEARICELDYTERFLRRKKLVTTDGTEFLVDLAQTTSLNHGDALALEDGTIVEIRAATEALYKITGAGLLHYAWHIGNRHTPCQIGTDHLLIMADKVIGHMLEHLGANVTPLSGPFTPEGGAYGLGRTHSHAHVATAHDPDHTHAH
jgi:urease accessory protein